MNSHSKASVLFLLAASAVVTLAEDRFSYVYSHRGKSYVRSSSTVDDIVRMSKKYTGDYIWVRKNGREHLIRDAAVLAEAAAAFRDVDALEPVMHEAEARVKPFEEKMEVLEQRMDEISDSFDAEELSEREERELEVRLRDIEQQIRDLEKTMRSVEADLERAEEQMDHREEVAERRLERIIEKAITRRD